MRLVQQNQEVDLQWLKQKEERMKKEQALMLVELEEDKTRRLVEATLTDLELIEDVSKTSQILPDALSELIAHSQSVKFIRINKWVTNASTDVKNQLTKVQDSTVETERCRQIATKSMFCISWSASNGDSFQRCD